MLKKEAPLQVVVTRGGLRESQHLVTLALWKIGQGLVGYAGSSGNQVSGAPILPRSAIKMLQAIPLVESGAFDHYELTDPMLALACGSHHGEEIHIRLLQEWMELLSHAKIRSAKLQESDLVCGPHRPYDNQAAEDLIRLGRTPGRLHNNCSGKHFGFLTTSLFFGDDTVSYHDENHPAQKRVRKVLSETMGLDFEERRFGIDGCGIPTYGIPLENIARGMASLLEVEPSSSRAQATARIVKACLAHPEYLSGVKDWATSVIIQGKGQVIIKVGAEGVVCGLLPAVGVSFAMKAMDGQLRAVQAVTFEILKFYGVLDSQQAQELWSEVGGQIKNTLQEVVGEVRVLTENN